MKPTVVSDPGISRTIPEVTIQLIDASIMDRTEAARALRTLARLLVRRHRQKGDPGPNVQAEGRSSSLTMVRDPSPHHGDEVV